jgi:hypothetical protein
MSKAAGGAVRGGHLFAGPTPLALLAALSPEQLSGNVGAVVFMVDVEEAGLGLANITADALQDFPGQLVITAAFVGDSIS